jgi:hypothetical protein
MRFAARHPTFPHRMNLLLVTHEEEQQHHLLPDVVRHITKLAPHVRCRLVHDCAPRLKHRLWTLGQRTAVVSMRPVWSWPKPRFAPEWAILWHQAPLDKLQECACLEHGGIPVPRWTALGPDRPPLLSDFGPFVVVKPASGALGALVRIKRRDRVRWEPAIVRAHPLTGGEGISDALIVQEYIHTGPWPTSYRVGTVFGEPIYALRVSADRSRRPFDARPADASAFSNRTIVASSRGSTFDDQVPEDVIQFATRVHAAFPTVPLLGTDIVRDCDTGQLYVLEVNAAGWTFHLTSVAHERFLRESGLDLRKQFGGAAAVARGLVRRLAAEGAA